MFICQCIYAKIDWLHQIFHKKITVVQKTFNASSLRKISLCHGKPFSKAVTYTFNVKAQKYNIFTIIFRQKNINIFQAHSLM